MAPGKKGHQSKMPGKEEGWKRGRKKSKKIKRERCITGQTSSMGNYEKQKDIKLVKQWVLLTARNRLGDINLD